MKLIILVAALTSSKNSKLITGLQPDLQELVEKIHHSKKLEEACVCLEQHLRLTNYSLLSVNFFDVLDEKRIYSPFGSFPCIIADLSKKFSSAGTCPISKLANHYLLPFDALSIDSARYQDFLSKRFLAELDKMDHRHVAVIPFRIGRGLFVCSVGLNRTAFTGEVKVSLVNLVCHVMISLVCRFPELSNLFEPKLLSLAEAEILLLISIGCSKSEIANSLNISEIAVDAFLDHACSKLEARTVFQLVAKSLSIGEIPDLNGF